MVTTQRPPLTDAQITELADRRSFAYDWLLVQLQRHGPTAFKVLSVEAMSWSITRTELHRARKSLLVTTEHGKWCLPEQRQRPYVP